MFYMGHKQCLLFYGLIIYTIYGAQPNETTILITTTTQEQQQQQRQQQQRQEQEQYQQYQAVKQQQLININHIIDNTNTKGQLPIAITTAATATAAATTTTTYPINSFISSTVGTSDSYRVNDNGNVSTNGSGSDSNSNTNSNTLINTNSATTTILDVVPEYCFNADPQLCYKFYDTATNVMHNNSGSNSGKGDVNDHGHGHGHGYDNVNGDSAVTIPKAKALKLRKAINYPMSFMMHNNNHCHCRAHPTINNSWYCCNITHISMITSCRHTNYSRSRSSSSSSKSSSNHNNHNNNNNNNNNWYNLHIHNMTMIEVDLSLSIFQTLHSLAITNGNISRLVKSFTRVSQIKCLNFSNNSLTNITMKAPPFLRFLNISKNNLTYLPKLKQNQNITLDVRDNKPLLCAPLLETIFRGSFRFVAPNSSYCLLDYNYNWFNSSDYVAISQLEMARRVHSECPVIPGKGNCTCAPEHMLSTGDPMKPEAKIFCRVDCSNLSLTELPPKLPENTFQLDITNNNITDIGKHFHNNPTYQSIVKLFADNNQIESMHDLEGTKFMDHFQQLHLRNNAISRLPEYLLNNALNSYMGRVIYLGGNKLICDCNSAKSLKQWLLQRSRDIPDYMDIMCRNMPQKVMELQEIKLCQAPHDWTDYVHYIIALEFLLFIALTTKVSYDYWVFKTAGYLPWPANKMPKLPCDCLCES